MLTPLVRHSVVISCGIVRVNKLETINADGLERWRAESNRPFPLTSHGAKSVCDALGLNADAAPRTLSAAIFENDLLSRVRPATLVQVTRQASEFSIGGCAVIYEITCAAGEMWQSVLIRHPDAQTLKAAMSAIGVQYQSNVSMSRMLNEIVNVDENNLGNSPTLDCHLDLQRIARLAKRPSAVPRH